MIKYIFIAVFVLSMAACQYKTSNYSSTMYQTSTERSLNDICFVDSDTGFVVADNLFGDGLILQTHNGGQSWDTLQLRDRGVNSIDYTNGELSFLQSGNTILRSYDYQNFSSAIIYGWWDWFQHTKLNDGRAILVGGNNFGKGFIHINVPGQTTFSVSDTFFSALKDVTCIPNQNLYTVGYGIGLRSTDQAASWQSMGIQEDFFRGIDFVSNDIGYIVGEYGTVLKTTNGGDSWQEVRPGNSLFTDDKKRWMDIAFLDENTGFIVGTSNMVWRTEDGGRSWFQLQDLDGWANFTAIQILGNKAYLAAESGQVLIIDL